MDVEELDTETPAEGAAPADAGTDVRTTEASEPTGTGADYSPKDDIRAAIAELTDKGAGEKPEKTAAERARDEQGKFAKQSKAPTAAATKAPVVTLKPQPGQAGPVQTSAAPTALKPPGGWRPAAREKWAQVPAEVQQEIKRLEAEATRGQSQSAPALKFQEEFEKVAAPYAATIAAEQAALGETGGPIKAFERYLQTATALRTSTPEAKSRMVVGVAASYGIPPDALIADLVASYRGDPKQLDEAIAARLQGRGPARSAAAPQPLSEEQLLAKFEEKLEQRQFSARVEKYGGDLEKFAAEHEYYEDLAPDMAKAIENGWAEDFEQAYAIAAALPKHKDIQAILQQREEAKAAQQSRGAIQQVRRAASSVKSNPTARKAPAVSDKDDRRADIREAMAELAPTR